MDQLLLKRACAGDPAAFEELITPLEGFVWRVCWHYTGNREDASDCAQEAMVKIWRSLKLYRQSSTLESWIYRIAANCCLDFLRAKKRQSAISVDQMAEEGFDPADPEADTAAEAEKKEMQMCLRNGIAVLPEEQRDALVLTQLEGLSYDETARVLGISEGTVKSRINRAREKLKKYLQEQELFCHPTVNYDERRTR